MNTPPVQGVQGASFAKQRHRDIAGDQHTLHTLHSPIARGLASRDNPRTTVSQALRSLADSSTVDGSL